MDWPLLSVGLEDTCNWQTFEPKCSRGEVIVMQHAHYGRMKTGR